MSAMTRPRDGRMIGGVCAGLARRFGIKTRTMRIIFVLSCLLPGPQFLIYLALWLLMPNERTVSAAGSARTAW
ncbi:PspC domain-containing protein [Streptomyces lavendulae subsp. lavendulae]|uniref:PspC domain-containing protein n=1 Tax=Streptomyces lavendulae TaxID=1914 RepID=UPI0024A512D6|nr:PspC domain-containing protein [Streptomyces lavendulae]GLV80557.1 PspC domain-containing protein [Streptomyces lavendulae subsp. lavendulae]GLX39311.1 PspC domain-containing protein [Streptomyces roseochromogenus]